MTEEYKGKSRGWCFTLNNYTEEDQKDIKEKLALHARYVIYGREVAPETGTPHLQGYIYFDNARQRRSVSKFLPRAKLIKANGTADQSYVYCSKDGDFVEYGNRPMSAEERNHKGGQGNKERYSRAIKLAEEGKAEEVKEDDPQLFLQYGPRLASLHQPDTRPIDGSLEHEWWVGPTGTGKSRLLWELYPDHFPKALNKWWDGYKHQEIVAIEEWSPKNDCTASALKRWADRYPFPGEVKGGTLHKLRPKKIIVLSNYTPQQCFLNSEDMEPILRRFTIIHFPEQQQHARFRAEDGSDSSTEVSLLETPMGEELPDLSLDGDFWGDQ